MEMATLQVTKRDELRKNNVKKLREDGSIPSIIYGNDKEPIPVTVNANQFEKALRTEYKKNTILKLEIDSKGKTITEMVIAYDIQRDVIKRNVTHVDFLRVEEGKEVRVHVPFVFEGVAPGTKRGGVLIKKMDTVHISTLPKELPASIKIDLSSLNVDEFISVDSLSEDNYRILTNKSNSIVRIAAPRKAADTAGDEGSETEDQVTEESSEESAE